MARRIGKGKLPVWWCAGVWQHFDNALGGLARLWRVRFAEIGFEGRFGALWLPQLGDGERFRKPQVGGSNPPVGSTAMEVAVPGLRGNQRSASRLFLGTRGGAETAERLVVRARIS